MQCFHLSWSHDFSDLSEEEYNLISMATSMPQPLASSYLTFPYIWVDIIFLNWAHVCLLTEAAFFLKILQCHTETSQSYRERQISHDYCLYLGSKDIVHMNLFKNRNTAIGVENRVVTRGWGWRGINWKIGIDIYSLLYIKQITNKDLL